MALHAPIIDRLWNSEYGDHLDFPNPNHPQDPTNVRTIGEEVVEIEVTQYLKEGVYRLDKFSSGLKSSANKLDVYRFVSPFHLGFVLQRLSALLNEGKTRTTVRSVKIDPQKLTNKQMRVLEEIFNQPVFDGTWNVLLNASKSESQHVTINGDDFDRCFSPLIEQDLLNKKADREEWTAEEDTLTDVYLLVSNGDRGFVSYNLSELYVGNVIELDEVHELVNSIIDVRLQENERSRYNYNRGVESGVREDSRQLVTDAADKMRHDALVSHAAKVLSEHNPNFKVSGEGEDYINYHVTEETGEFPYVVEYNAPLWRLSVPGLTEAVVGNSMSKKEALRMITDGFTLETKIKPLSEDDIHRLQNQYYIRGMDNVEWGRFTYSVKRDKR